MTNDDFRAYWDLLDAAYKAKSSGSKLSELSAAGMINFAAVVQADLEEWIKEVVARAKAEFDTAKSSHDHLRETVGDRFDAIEPNYMGGLKFESR